MNTDDITTLAQAIKFLNQQRETAEEQWDDAAKKGDMVNAMYYGGVSQAYRESLYVLGKVK